MPKSTWAHVQSLVWSACHCWTLPPLHFLRMAQVCFLFDIKHKQKYILLLQWGPWRIQSDFIFKYTVNKTHGSPCFYSSLCTNHRMVWEPSKHHYCQTPSVSMRSVIPHRSRTPSIMQHQGQNEAPMCRHTSMEQDHKILWFQHCQSAHSLIE
jgi:hypothetical protein